MHRQLRQLLLRLLLGVGAHPVERVDVRSIGRQQIVHQRQHMRAGLRREMLRHVLTAQGFSDRLIHQTHATLPAHFVRGGAAQHGAVESKILVRERFVEIRSKSAQQPPPQVGLPDRQRSLRDDLAEAAHVTGLADNDGVDLVANAGCCEESVPIVVRRERAQLPQRQLVVSLHRVTVLDPRPLNLRQPGFQSKDFRRFQCRRLISQQAQHLLDVSLVFRAGVLQFRVIVLEVIVPIRQAEPALVELEDVTRRVACVLRDADIVGSRDIDLLKTSDDVRQLFLAAQRLDGHQVCFERVHADGFDSRLIHETGIQIADLLRFRAGRMAGRCRLLDDIVQLVLRDVGQLVVEAIGGLVLRNRGFPQPGTVRVRVEVVLGTHADINGLANEAGGTRRSRSVRDNNR